MHRSSLALWLLLAIGAAAAHAADAVTNTLRVSRVIAQANGVERKEEAASAKPGDLLEYEAVYRNSGGGTVRQLQATVPIPAGSVYVADSTQPSNALASVDGITYSKIPLQRSVRQANGVLTEQVVALSEYRFVRWSLSDLPAGAARTVSVRVAIPNDVTGGNQAGNLTGNLKVVK